MKLLAKTMMLAAAATLVMAGSAQATDFTITSDHCSGGGCLDGLTNGGTISVTDQGGGTLLFQVALNPVLDVVNTGFDASFGFNLASNPTITYSGLQTNFSAAGPSAPSLTEAAGSLHMDGTGFFEYGIDWCCNPSTPGPSSFSFSITGTGLTLNSLETNALGQFFAIDVLNTVNGRTGGVDVSNAPPQLLPDGGSTLTLLGMAVFGLGMLRRRLASC